MSKMGLLGAIGFSLALVSLSQILKSAEGCSILSATSSSASSILVKWQKSNGATNYFLDLRVQNNTNTAPVVVSVPATATEKDVQGLKPGTNYTVTLKVFQFYYVDCTTTVIAGTVPDTSQITTGKALSSNSAFVQWTLVPSADYYKLMIHSQTTGADVNLIYTSNSATVGNLQPSSNYDFYVYTVNHAGTGSRSKVRTITTLVRPPVGITVVQTGQYTVSVSWQPVTDVLLYRFVIRNLDDPNSKPSAQNVTNTKTNVNGILPCSNYLISVSSYNQFLVPSEPTDYTYTTNKLLPVSSVTLDYSCTNNLVTVSWAAVLGAESYNATLTDTDGNQLTCTSSSSSCQITGLSCGRSYEARVVPMSANCKNTISNVSATFKTVPCPPINLELQRNCSSDAIIFSWEETNSTDYYVAKAVNAKGVVQECLTEEPYCYFTNTLCGHHYSFTVYSAVMNCKSQASATVDIRTAPCIPQNVQTSSDCRSDVLISKWDLAEGALRYKLEAYGNKGSDDEYTCNSQSNSCTIEGIQCGEHLTVYITAFDDECASPRTLAPPAETVPCTPENVTAVKECGADSITASWTMTRGAIFYIAIAQDSAGKIHNCNSMDMVCEIEGLKCSTNYTVYVVATNLMCNSSESDMITIETAACPPNNVTAFLDCAANEALISWDDKPQINSFTVTLEDEDQGLLSCSSTIPSCRVPNLKCGKLYTVTVRHHDSICPSVPSQAIYMESVPCGPANTQANMNCTSGELTIDWDSTPNAEGYNAVISDGNGQMSYNTTQHMLSINTLVCGMEYTVMVASFNHTCVSFSSVVHVKGVPCVPTNVVASRNCGRTSVEVMWDASLGAESYTAAAVGEDGSRLQCVSNLTSCSLEGITCSQVYNVSVAAVDVTCTSPGSSMVKQVTAPCPPSHLTVSMNCSSNSTVLTWESSPNAVAYTGKAVSTDGHNVTCAAGAQLSCELLDLHCGKEYTFTVSASDGDCQSPDSAPVIQTTAPCTVNNVVSTMNCNSNTLTVSWTPASMPVNYSVTAQARNTSSASLQCITEGSNCTLTNLVCGEQYTVTVNAISSTCTGHSSVPEIVNSVPCMPVNVQGVIECSTHTVHASWDALCPTCSDFYTSTLTGAGGFSASCSTATESCNFPGLQCAQTYSLSVVSVSDRCNSSESAAVSLTTAPCDPTNVNAALDCASGLVTVTWVASNGASSYTVLAEANGHTDSCTSTGTSCGLTQLQCGEDFTVTVLAGDGHCNSSILATTSITTAPCAPEIQDHSLDCASNHAVVTWFADGDAVSTAVSATSSMGHSSSCSSPSSMCILDDLQCGQTYTVQAVAQGPQCPSEPSSTFQIVTAPCTPDHVEMTYSCDTNIGLLMWDETLGRDSFYVYAESGDHIESCSTTQTNCDLNTMLCGRTYDVKVIAVADHCNSSVPGVTQIQTAPCGPTNVSASLVCDNNTAAVSWQQSSSADSYEVTAQGRDGDVKHCTTTNTSCHVANLHCGVTYFISVSPISSQCSGIDSETYVFTAGPCPPTDVQASLQCDGNVGHVTWTAALQADLYVATAVDDHEHTCSSNGTSCSLTDLQCGETSVITVVTIERGCMSKPSLPFMFQSVICPPNTVTGVTNCQNNDITVSWEPSPETGVSYVLQSQEGGSASANYSTAQTSHVITGLQCGELYTLSVASTDSECPSAFSLPIETETAPCPPTNLTATAGCGTNLGTLTWAPSTNAISYTTTVTGTHGHVASCTSNGTSCSVKLDCGRQYSAVVIASSATCNSSAGDTITFNSAPCLPDKVVADLDCNANSFAVQWQGSTGDVGFYTAIAIGSDGTRAECNTTNTNCTIDDLKCGLTYSIVVTTPLVDCGTIEGSDYSIQSAPCKPDSVAVNLECNTNSATVTWENTGPDQTQTVSAVDTRGTTTSCNSTSSNCTLEQLECGERYDISVVSHTNSCSSDPTLTQMLNAAPCIPTYLVAQVDCNSGITMVFWDSALGATSYTVYAQGSLGFNDECASSTTNCDFTGLACGQDYNITVVAHSDSCDSLVSESIVITTGPCPLTDPQVYLECDTNTAMVSWTPGSGILSYTATADAFSTTDTQSCTTTGSSCNITSLLCAVDYRVSVTGQGQDCPSPAQNWYRITTVPCAPTNLAVASTCSSNDIVVSWQASQGSLSYMAVAEDAQGHKWSCNTSSTSCLISALPCGEQYQVYVVGVDNSCYGVRSNVEMIGTAPCVPQNVDSHLDCRMGVLNVTWQSTGNFSQFRASVAGSNGHVITCETQDHHCVVSTLQCDQTYSVTVVAEDNHCNSSQSAALQVVAAPCSHSSFVSTVNCATGVVSVTWTYSMPGVVYTVSAVDKTGQSHNCTGTSSGCDLSTLVCGKDYNITITPSRDGCVGKDSPTEMITTVPCIPEVSDVEIDCLTNSAWVVYEESAGAENYVIMVTDSQGANEVFDCNETSEGVCSLPELKCSENLTFTLQARDQQCSSPSSNAITTETAPCAPRGVLNTVSCDGDTVSITWPAVPGAVMYTATLENINGNTSCCTTSGTGCDITGLPCGQMYVLHVTGEGRVCNSSQSDGVITRTAPCAPRNLGASLSCSNNVASMSWSYSNGGQLYRVRAVSADGHEAECVTYQNQCDLTGLRCGQTYTASVAAEDMNCSSVASDRVTIKTAPCTPENVSSVVDCEANALIVSWSDSPGADSYIATVEDSNSQTTTCQGTSEGSCNVTALACGQVYHVFVVSSNGYCNSPPSSVVDTPPVPCEPLSIGADFDCYTETAIVGWQPSDGAASYTVTAIAASGHSVTCDTNSTHCDLEGLRCGESYSVSVTAVGQTCNSSGHMTGQLVTGPCIPAHITTDYSLGIGQVLWDSAAGTDDYVVEGVTDQGLTVSCATDDTYCALNNLECGQLYSISVTANSNVCQGVAISTETVVITTEPCPPNNVEANVNCETGVGIVSWETSFSAVRYEVQLAGRNGHSLTCNTNETFCYVEDLQCGVVYYTSVISIGETLNSEPSTTVVLVAASCEPANIAADMDCDNSSAVISWSLSIGIDSYMVTAVSAEGDQATCETSEDHCEVTDLKCGQTYNISLTTINTNCQAERHTNVTITTRPCAPLYVGVDLQCGTSTAILQWQESEGVELYMATATCSMGAALHCNSTNSTCHFPNLQCGKTYQFSATAYSNGCYSETSNTVEIQTEPCQPTGLVVNGSCYNETVVLDWSAAPGALVYLVTASGNLGYVTVFQTNETMIETELPCGQLFTFTVKAQDDRCEGAVSLPVTFKRAPCIPWSVQSYINCEDSLGAVSWAMTDGAESYLAIATGQDGHTHMCATNTTTCTWDDLHCGEIYTVQVISNDLLCSSMPSNSTEIHMAPCIPQNLTSSLNCSMRVGSMTWLASSTAEFYLVTAESLSGHQVQLSTNDTWTFISEFQCGQEYFLSVQAVDSVCTSQPSQLSVLKSEPCAPTNVSSFMDCHTNIAVVSWMGSAGAEYYTATVVPEDGPSKTCWSDMTHCGMPNVACGQNYTVTVVASNEKCNSDPSEAETLQSVPCVPTDVNVTVDCSDNEALVSWSPSEGALSYKVSAQSMQGHISFCMGTATTCTLTNLVCGQTYSVQVEAEDDICSSLPSPAKTFKSVPCTPDNASVVLDCFTNTALLVWFYAEGALEYTATARSTNNHASTCNTNITNCELHNLHCGETYHVIVVASNEVCNSPPSSSLEVKSVPCPPASVVASLDCSANTAQVEWQAAMGADFYFVQAFGIEEHNSSCETSSQSCTLPDLLCGFTYNITVVATNEMCNVSESDNYQLQAAPCVPQQVEAHVVCETGAVDVSWEPSKGATSYSAFAQGNAGYASVCNNTVTTCQFTDLLCGHNYSITVSASDETCRSAESSAVEINTVRCVPQNVTAEIVCSNNTGVVSWEEEDGVSSYRVQAFGPDGHRPECTSSEASCELLSLHCGQLYNMTVTAQDGQCDNSYAYLDLHSAPCTPTNAKASLQCQSNSVAVTWERASGAAYYLAVAVTEDSSHRTECMNNQTYCDLTNLQCGQTYNVSVFSHDDSCSSMESSKSYVRTAPCQPQSVTVTPHCAEGTMTVSWSPNPDAQYFHVAAVSNTGARLYCNSTGTTCTFSGLPCGQKYNITVLSVRDDCESQLSAVVHTSSAPCLPRNTVSHLDCISNSAWVTWDAADGAVSYHVYADGGNGQNSSCTSKSSPCEVADLKCGTLYTVEVTSSNAHCHSNGSATFELVTGPCALTSISAVTQCHSNTIVVEWEKTVSTPLYLVTAEAQDQTLIMCNSTSSSCALENIRCGTQYSIIVSASSNKCSNLRSPPKKIKTAPCVPDNVTVAQSCDEEGVTVTWEPSSVVTSSIVTATGQDGHVAACNTSVNNCTLTHLHCGQTYNLSIIDHGENCTSHPSLSSFETVPCQPSGLIVDIDCKNKSAILSWNAKEGVVEYYGCAQSNNGDAHYCDSTVPSCTFEGLECGEMYNFSVQASNGVCNSSFSAPLAAGPVPCPPTSLKVRMRRIEQRYWAMASWDHVNCSYVEYMAEITGRIQNNPMALMAVSSYWLPRNYFEFPMPCSTAYNLTVRARNSAGAGSPSAAFTGVTAPCHPENVRYSGSTQSAVLSWDASVFATEYTVYSVSGGDRVRLCNTSGLSCQLTNFNSSAIAVTASNEIGESNPNGNVTGPVVSRRRRDLTSGM